MIIEQLLEFNRQFVANRQYEQFVTSKYPDKKLAILSCMDTRLTELLPAALGLKNGDAKIIKMRAVSLSARSTLPCALSSLPSTSLA